MGRCVPLTREETVRQILLMILLGGSLAACVTEVYRMGYNTYSEPDAALAAQAELFQKALTDIETKSVTFPGKAIFFIPTERDIEQRGAVNASNASRRFVEYRATMANRGLGAMAAAARKRGLFKDVEVRGISGMAPPSVGPGEHGVWLKFVSDSDYGWKYLNASISEPLSVPLNMSLAQGAPRANAWLDTLTDVVERNGGRSARHRRWARSPMGKRRRPAGARAVPSGRRSIDPGAGYWLFWSFNQSKPVRVHGYSGAG